MLLFGRYRLDLANFIHVDESTSQRTVNGKPKEPIFVHVKTTERISKNHLNVNTSLRAVIKPRSKDIVTASRYWQVFDASVRHGSTQADTTDRPVFIANALYDDRLASQDSPCVRLFSITQHYNRMYLVQLCYFWRENEPEPVEISKATVQTINSVKQIVVNGTIYKQYLITCPLSRPDINISSVSIGMDVTRRDWSAPLTNAIPVFYPKRQRDDSKWEHEFGMCVMISYGSVPDAEAHWLIEWFELHRLLGVTEIHIYNGTLQLEPQIARIFAHYQTQGMLKVTQQPPPVDYPPAEYKMAAKMATRSALNDCMYKNMYRFHFMIIVDMDEVIIPAKHDNYTQLMQALNNNNYNNTSLRFHSKAFYLEYEPLSTNTSSLLRTERYCYHAPVSAWRRAKSIINPRQCLYTYSHYCLKPLDSAGSERAAVGAVGARSKHEVYKMAGAVGARSERAVHEAAGAVHHYRATCFSSNNPSHFSHEACNETAKQRVLDDTAARFKVKLLPAVIGVHRALDIDTQL